MAQTRPQQLADAYEAVAGVNHYMVGTYADAKAIRDRLEADMRHHADALKAYPKGAMNLTADSARATPEWQASNYHFVEAWAALRRFNANFVRQFKREIAAERKAAHR